MNELSLFTGAGGGVLGSKILGWRTIGYVEKDEYCQKIIAQRIKDGIFDDAPIFADVQRFVTEGFASMYRGYVDVLTAGFPCQPFSVAGKRAAGNDERNMWPATIECIRRIRPKYAFLENVPGLLSTDYFWKILGDLRESGFDARWDVISAADVGANHKRSRLWIFAYSDGERFKKQRKPQSNEKEFSIKHICEDVANAGSDSKGSPHGRPRRASDGQFSDKQEGSQIWNDSSNSCKEMANTECDQFKRSGGIWVRRREYSNPGWWSVEPELGRVAHGVANRINRLRAIGNGQVPLTMAYAFSKLSEGII